jgi:hypothetical protein
MRISIIGGRRGRVERRKTGLGFYLGGGKGIMGRRFDGSFFFLGFVDLRLGKAVRWMNTYPGPGGILMLAFLD